MKKDETRPIRGEQSATITNADVQALLGDLNIDALIASLDSTREPEPRSAPPPPDTAPATAGYTEERRSARRRDHTELSGDIRMTIPGVPDILMVNISETGALIETSRRLSPGVAADLFVRLNGKRYTVRAMTIRSTLHTIASGGRVVYRTALQFDKQLCLEAA
jgi:hypothetical protein